MPSQAKSDPGKDVEQVREVTVTSLAKRKKVTIDDFFEMLADVKESGEVESEDAEMRILRQIFDANSVEAILTPLDALQAIKLIGHAFFVEGFDLNQSDFDVGSPFYASMRCTYAGHLPPHELDVYRITDPSPPLANQPDMPNLNPGDKCVINDGHKRVLAQLIATQEKDGFPQLVTVKQTGVNKKYNTKMLALQILRRTSETDGSEEGPF